MLISTLKWALHATVTNRIYRIPFSGKGSGREIIEKNVNANFP
jgi:hypothetical protein